MSTPEKAAPRERIAALDIIRGLMILLMIADHILYDSIAYLNAPSWLRYNPVMDVLQNRRALAGEGKEFYFEKNLLEMLRQGRQAKHYVDFTGIDFRGIDMTGVDLCQVVFAHKRRGEVWAANLKDTGVEAYFANK